MNSDERILESFRQNNSVRQIVKETGFSWNKVVKSLSSNNIIINETHRLILELWAAGNDIKYISKQVGVSEKTVASYLPRRRPIYGENRSKNAEYLMHMRNGHEKVAKVIFNKSGGSGKNGVTNRVTIPTRWIREMGITERDRAVKISFDGRKIAIEKYSS